MSGACSGAWPWTARFGQPIEVAPLSVSRLNLGHPRGIANSARARNRLSE